MHNSRYSEKNHLTNKKVTLKENIAMKEEIYNPGIIDEG